MAPFYISFNSSRMWSSSSAFAVTQPGDKRTDPTVTVLSMQWCETQAWEHISVLASVILTFPSHAVGCIHPLLGWETGLSSGQVPLGGWAAHGPPGFCQAWTETWIYAWTPHELAVFPSRKVCRPDDLKEEHSKLGGAQASSHS